MVDDQTAILVQTALKNCNKEKDLNSLIIPLENVYERVSFYTGLPNKLICDISNDMDETTQLDRSLLLESIKILLAENKQPTATNVYSEFFKLSKIKGCEFNISLAVFLQKLNDLGFKHRKSQTGQFIIMENPIVTFRRNNYLSEILELRKTHKVFYYIDAKQFDDDKETDTYLQGYVHFFMVSSGSYEHGLFTTQATSNIFKNWITDILLPIIKPSSVIVLCTDEYLDSKINITGYSSKTEMCQWLRNNNIPFDTSMRKAELFELIDKCGFKHKPYDIDRLFKSHGHEILHLPSSFNIAPTKLMYQHIMSVNNIEPGIKIKIKQTVLDAIKLISSDEWKKFEKKTIHFENEIYLTDAYIERNFDTVCKLDNKYNNE